MKNKNIESTEDLAKIVLFSSHVTTQIDKEQGNTPKEKFINYFMKISKRSQSETYTQKFMLSTGVMIMDLLIDKAPRENLMKAITKNIVILLVICKKSLMKFASNRGDDILSKINLDEELKSDYVAELFAMDLNQLLDEYASLKRLS